MGKLIILVIVIALVGLVAVGVVTAYNRLSRRDELGLAGSKKRMEALQRQNRKYAAALTEIRDLADSSQVTNSDPLWSFVYDKADAVLAEKGIEK